MVEERRDRGPGLGAVPDHPLELRQLGEEPLVQPSDPLGAGVYVLQDKVEVVEELPTVGHAPPYLMKTDSLLIRSIRSHLLNVLPGSSLPCSGVDKLLERGGQLEH